MRAPADDGSPTGTVEDAEKRSETPPIAEVRDEARQSLGAPSTGRFPQQDRPKDT